jgi:hypothetical protein
VAVIPRNDAGEFAEAWGDRAHKAPVVGLGVSEEVPVEVRIPKLGGLPSFDLSITYSDVADKGWITAATYLALGGRPFSGPEDHAAARGIRDVSRSRRRVATAERPTNPAAVRITPTAPPGPTRVASRAAAGRKIGQTGEASG